jgi:hypothetical protein
MPIQPVGRSIPSCRCGWNRHAGRSEASFARFQRGDGWLADAASGGLIGASLSGLARWLKSQDDREDA